MSDVFSHIYGQDSACSMLRHLSQTKQLAQSYLFVGSACADKLSAATCLAAAYLCEEGTGCGVCDTCKRVMAHAHPDVHHLEPSGVNSY